MCCILLLCVCLTKKCVCVHASCVVVRACVCEQVRAHTCMHVSYKEVCVCVCVCACVCVCVHVCVCVCVYVCVCLMSRLYLLDSMHLWHLCTVVVNVVNNGKAL